MQYLSNFFSPKIFHALQLRGPRQPHEHQMAHMAILGPNDLLATDDHKPGYEHTAWPKEALKELLHTETEKLNPISELSMLNMSANETRRSRLIYMELGLVFMEGS